MNINPDIFRSYDIRGIYPTDLDESAAHEIGRAYAQIVKGASGVANPKVVVGRDMRLSSPGLSESLIKGLVSSGVHVEDTGLCTVDLIYVAVGKLDYHGGIMVTASHNPKEYGGMKMVVAGLEWITGKTIREEIGSLSAPSEDGEGSVVKKDLWDMYINHVRSFMDPAAIKPLKVVVDAGNGMASMALDKLKNDLPIEIVGLNYELDGNFPGRPSNPLAPGASDAVIEKVKEVGADMGVLFDGDTDRLMFIDEQGTFIQADTTLIFLAKHFLKKFPGKAVSYNAICSKAVPEMVEKFGGRPIRTPVGFLHVSKGISENDGVLGGEVSAHYAFADNFFADSGIIAFIVVLQVVSESGMPLSQLAQESKPYVRGDEVNLTIEDKPKVLEALKEKYKDEADIDTLDGVTVSFSDWWFNVRPSNTEPLLRVTVEAGTQEEMEAQRNKLVEYIKSIA